MPIYLMECTSCNHSEERYLNSGDVENEKDGIYPTVKCNACSKPTKKMTSFFDVGLDFKGDWFATKGKY